jgi:glycosidase
MNIHRLSTKRVRQCCLSLLLALGTVTASLAADSTPVRSAPDWLRGSVIYEIFPRNFSPSGDFKGITARLDDLKALGVDVLWLMPVHPIGEKLKKGSIGSPYAVRDYYALNPDYGTTADFDALVTAAHQRGLKVIIDIVANHTSWDSVMMKHPEFYKRDASGKIQSPADWYDVAWLNYDEPKLRRYMIDMLKYWLRERRVDGFRCDVAYMVPTDFWEQARTELEQVNPNVMMLAEASHPELLRKAFDMDYSWPLHATLNRVMIEGAPASDLRASWEESRRQFPAGALHLRISDNHDEARAVARFGIRGALATQVLMLTLDGVPLFYNGMEVGDATESGAPALFEKLPIYWEPKERPPLRGIYQELIRLRKAHPAFTKGAVVWLRNSAETDLVTFMRMDGKDEFVAVINLSNRPVVGSVDVMHADQFKPVRITGTPEVTGNGFPLFRLNAFEWRIYHRAAK